MRKTFLIFALSMLQTGWVCALYVGNPSFPMMPEEGLFISKESWFTLKTGYEWDDLFNRKLIVKDHRAGLNRSVNTYASMGNFGTITIGCIDRVELYGVLGSVAADMHYRPFSDERLHFKTDGQFAWEIGGRAILAYWGDIQFGVDAKYFRFNPDIHHLKVNGQSISPQGADYDYQEWQIGLGVSYRVMVFMPYAGLKYSNTRAKFHHLKAISSIFPSKHFTMKNNIPIGAFLGFGISPERAFSFNAEARFWDETAVTVSADLRY